MQINVMFMLSIFSSFNLCDFEITLSLSKLSMNEHFICKSSLWENRYCVPDLNVPKFASVYPFIKKVFFSLLSIYSDNNNLNNTNNEAMLTQAWQVPQSVLFSNRLLN